ncbi:MAG: hypothetical protein R6X10_06805 [Desulfobacterales bacterium]
MKTITIYVFFIFLTILFVFPINHTEVQLLYEDQIYNVFENEKGRLKDSNRAKDRLVILSPNLEGKACNDFDPSNPEFPTHIKCPEDTSQTLSIIVGNKLYKTKDVEFVRLENQYAMGNSKATNITGLFLWTGWVFDANLDGNDDGAINVYDVPFEYDLLENGGNKNGVIDPIEFDNWVSDQEFSGLASYYEDEWILNIDNLVLKDQITGNRHSELLKI